MKPATRAALIVGILACLIVVTVAIEVIRTLTAAPPSCSAPPGCF